MKKVIAAYLNKKSGIVSLEEIDQESEQVTLLLPVDFIFNLNQEIKDIAINYYQDEV